MTIPQVIGHVQERPDAQGDPRRLRLPPAVSAGQSAAHVRGVRGPPRPGHPHERDARAVGAAARLARSSSSSSGPTGIVDPRIEVRPTEGQIDDLHRPHPRARRARASACIVTTLTKRMAEDLADYLHEMGVKVSYLHSEVDTLERVQILRDLRLGVYDVLVGINLLREGIDLPEVTLVAILDADKEGFLRSAWSLIQVIGRAARNISGEVVMYADARDRVDAGRDRGDEPAARDPGGLQRRARHPAHDDRQGDPRHQRPPARGRRRRRAPTAEAARALGDEPGAGREAHRPARGGDALGRQAARVRACGRAARRDPGHPPARARAGRLGGGPEGRRASRAATGRWERRGRGRRTTDRQALGARRRSTAGERRGRREADAGVRARGRPRSRCCPPTTSPCEGIDARARPPTSSPASRTPTRTTTRAGWRAGSTGRPGTAASRPTSSSAPARGAPGADVGPQPRSTPRSGGLRA